MDKTLKNVLSKAGGTLNLSSSVGHPELFNPKSTVTSNHDYGSMRDFSQEILHKKTAMAMTRSSKNNLNVHPAWIKTDNTSQKQSRLLSRATSASVRNQHMAKSFKNESDTNIYS